MPPTSDMLTPRDLALVAAAVLGSIVALWIVARCARWLAGRRDPIDRLIAANAFRYGVDADGIPMWSVDWRKTERAGEKVWQQAVRAQRKDRTQPAPPRLLKIADRCR